MNITADNWALLWSAVIGAIIAGGSAAAVAMVVLGKTREHQAELAKTQLKEQRLEAELARRLEALADVAAALAAIGTRTGPNVVQGVTDLTMSANAGLVRWRVNHGGEGVAEVLAMYLGVVSSTRLDLIVKKGAVEEGARIRTALGSAAGMVQATIMKIGQAESRAADHSEFEEDLQAHLEELIMALSPSSGP